MLFDILNVFLLLKISKPDTNQLTNLTSFEYTGLSSKTFYENLYQDYGRDYTTASGQMVDFAAVFGVLFTGVTGVMAGANMSGKLHFFVTDSMLSQTEQNLR